MDNNNCGCKTNCRDLMKKLRMLDFAIYDTVLYLDAYPDSGQALECYHRLLEQRGAVLCEYQAKCGPLTMFGNESRSAWQWINMPWPWEYDAN